MKQTTFIKRTEGVNRNCLAYLMARNLMHGSSQEHTCTAILPDIVIVLELAGLIRNKDFMTIGKKDIKIISKRKIFKHV